MTMVPVQPLDGDPVLTAVAMLEAMVGGEDTPNKIRSLLPGGRALSQEDSALLLGALMDAFVRMAESDPYRAREVLDQIRAERLAEA